MNEREALLYSLCEDDLELSRSYSDTENEGIQGQVSTGAYVKRKFDLGNWFSTATTGHGFQRTRVSEPEKCQFTVPVGSSLSSKRNAALSRAGKQIDSTSTDTDTDEDATTPAKGGKNAMHRRRKVLHPPQMETRIVMGLQTTSRHIQRRCCSAQDLCVL